jgi:putative phosphoribosyl transferase
MNTQNAIRGFRDRREERALASHFQKPVSSPETCAAFREEVDEIVCAITEEEFRAVSQFYQDFSQTTDEEVRELLASAAGGGARP